MLASLIGLLIAFAFRIVMGYLATRYKFLQSWLLYITILVIVLAVVFMAFVISKLMASFRKAGSRKNKEDNHEKD